MNYLLDTNILLIYTQTSSTAELIEKDLKLFTSSNNLFTSVTSIGEIESLMIQRNYGKKRRAALKKLLSTIVVVDINIQEVILRYAEIGSFSQGKNPSKSSTFSARNMGKNDLWIAATGSYYDLTWFFDNLGVFSL